MLNSFFLQAVNNLMDNSVNDSKDISKAIPGPDVDIATNDRKDLENGDKESEMIKTAINGRKCGQLGAHGLNKMAGSHKSKGKFRPSLQNSSRLT